MTTRSAYALSRVPSGADRRMRRARTAAVRTENTVRLMAAAVVLLTLALGLSSALRGAAADLTERMAVATSSQSR
jgi:hypothetical protein